MPKLDPKLIVAIDELLSKQRAKMISRIELGELSYKGTWKQMTIQELLEAIEEELLDAAVYQAMIQSKLTDTPELPPPPRLDREA